MSNIFAKLSVASRAAATAYAYEHELVCARRHAGWNYPSRPRPKLGDSPEAGNRGGAVGCPHEQRTKQVSESIASLPPIPRAWSKRARRCAPSSADRVRRRRSGSTSSSSAAGRRASRGLLPRPAERLRFVILDASRASATLAPALGLAAPLHARRASTAWPACPFRRRATRSRRRTRWPTTSRRTQRVRAARAHRRAVEPRLGRGDRLRGQRRRRRDRGRPRCHCDVELPARTHSRVREGTPVRHRPAPLAGLPEPVPASRRAACWSPARAIRAPRSRELEAPARHVAARAATSGIARSRRRAAARLCSRHRPALRLLPRADDEDADRAAVPKVAGQGGPLIRVKPGICGGGHPARAAGGRGADGLPLEDGRILDVTNVIWCTGFDPAFRG